MGEELSALVESVQQLNRNAQRLGENQGALANALEAIEDKLPGLVTKDEVTERERKVRTLIAVLLVIFVLAVAVITGGFVLYRRAIQASNDGRDAAIVTNTCVLKSLLESAQSSTTRNPIPPGLDEQSRAFVEKSRADAARYYAETLHGLNGTLADLNSECPPPRPAES